MISDNDKQILALIQRTIDRGEGWRNVSQSCWPIIMRLQAKELIEIDELVRKVRLSDRGKIVVDYLL